jgi:hypothetical protein
LKVTNRKEDHTGRLGECEVNGNVSGSCWVLDCGIGSARTCSLVMWYCHYGVCNLIPHIWRYECCMVGTPASYSRYRSQPDWGFLWFFSLSLGKLRDFISKYKMILKIVLP